MGERKRSLRDLLRKADAGQTYLRAYEAVGIRGDGYGRQYSSDMPTVRDNENEGGSSEDSESQTTKITFIGIEEIPDTTPIWKGKQMEKTNGRDHSAPSYNWRGFLESASKSMEIAASKDGDPLVNAHRVAKIMGALYDISIHPTDVARVMHCQAIMLASQDQGNVDKHRNVVATAAALAELTKPQGEIDLAQLRIQTEMANQLAGLPST